MRPLAALERLIERVVERPSARLFRARLQPIQLQRRLERAMDAERLTTPDGTLVPNRYAVHLSPEDLAGFGDAAAGLAGELADGCLVFARRQRWMVADRPQIALVADEKLGRGDVRVLVRFAKPEPGPSRMAAAGDSPSASPSDGEPVTSDHTMVYRPPLPSGPVARLSVVHPDGHRERLTIDGALVRIGRAADNDVVLRDAQVSRYHARLQTRAGLLILTDLGSTNGTLVNGARVGEIALGGGDEVVVGDTLLIVEPGPAI